MNALDTGVIIRSNGRWVNETKLMSVAEARHHAEQLGLVEYQVWSDFDRLHPEKRSKLLYSQGGR